ncbi:MAG: ribosome small subunit-dependent GTPase A [Gammaproteobacteria bacterium]
MSSNIGIITACFGTRGYLDTGDGERRRYILKGRKLRAVCGDRVYWQEQDSGSELLVTEIQERSNLLERPDTRGKAEPLAANIDKLLIVLASEPEPDCFIADRYICAAELIHAAPVIIWNKTDLSAGLPDDLQTYRSLDYPVVETSAIQHSGIKQLSELIAGATSMLAGQSGVGKSSLINILIPDAEAAVGELSAASGEGKHTTTASVMHTLANKGRLIDTPGVREFAPAINGTERIQLGFREIARLADQCRFSDCKHLREPDCAVKTALENGEISARRYESYKRLLNTTTALEQR